MLYELVMGGMLATAFLPVYLSVKQRAGREGANRYTSNLLSIVMLFMGILTVVGIVFAGQVVWTQSFGATSDFDFDLATYFFRFFAIEVILYALSSVISGVLNAERDYLWSNAAPIFNNIVCTSSFFLYIAFAESNPSLAILCLALGNPLGVAIQVLMQLPSLRKHGISLKPRIDFRDPALRETLSIGIPSLVVTICSFITVSVQNSSALSVTVSGSSIAYYTRIWYTLPYSIFAIPITTAMFTELSNYVSKGDLVATARGVASGTSKILFMLIPFTLYLMVFSEPLIMLMAGGRFTADQVTLTAQYLVVLAASLPMYGVCTYQQKVCSSLRRMKLYMVSIALGSVVQVAFCLVLTPMYGLMMVPLSSVFFFTLVDVVTFVSLRRQLGNMGLKSVLFSALKATVLGALGAGVGYGLLMVLQSNFGPLGSSILQALAYTVAAGIPAVLVTFGIAVALRMPEAATFSSILGRFLPKRSS
jgi:putative peptidoglycan lipid II flippase